MANSEENEEESPQPDNQDEQKPAPKSSGSVRDLLQRHAESIQQAVSRMEVNRKRKFYFLTVPGVIRIIQVILAVLNLSVFGYYCNSYEQIENMIPPYCLSQTREQYFMLCNYSSFMGCLIIVLAGVFSPFSNAALLSSLFPLIFDAVQASLIFISTITLMQFYKSKSDKINEVMPDGISAKVGLTFVGFFLACLHVASAIYDAALFIKYLRAFRSEEKALKKEEAYLIN